jgi:GNAT superfamily N-acetyltransferase
MSIKIDELREEHLGDAAELVNARYKVLRQKLPILPVAYESVDIVVSQLHELMEHPCGVVALCGKRLVGFLGGLVIPEFFGKQAIYSPDWANGSELGENRRIYEEMYAHLSRRWVDEGNLIHAVSILSHDHQGNEAWKWLGFGLSGVDGVREIKPFGIGVNGLDLRKAGMEYIEIVSSLDRALERHMSESPTFWIHDLVDYEEWLKEPRNVVWLAYQKDQPVGYMAVEPGANCECAFLRDNKTINIAGAFTIERERNRGIAATILNQALRWAQEEGYERCAVDFEAMNVLASRFWMRWFDPVSYSWIRWIDERLRRD